jgi:hypothetical protein
MTSATPGFGQCRHPMSVPSILEGSDPRHGTRRKIGRDSGYLSVADNVASGR